MAFAGAFGHYPAVMHLDQQFHQGQPETETAFAANRGTISSHKRLEQPWKRELWVRELWGQAYFVTIPSRDSEANRNKVGLTPIPFS